MYNRDDYPFTAPDQKSESSRPADADQYTGYRPPPRSAGASFPPGDWRAYGRQEFMDYSRGEYGRGPFRPEPPPRINPGLKMAAIIVSVLILIVATAFIFMEPQLFSPHIREGELPERTAPVFTRPPEFSRRPDVSDGESGGTDLPRGDVGSGVVMELVSRDDSEIKTLQDIYKLCSRWVVAIEAEAGPDSYNWGTGILLTGDGYVVTNNHIIEGTSAVAITLFDDSVYEAVLIGTDAKADLAVLKIDAGSKELPFAVFGDSSEIEVGEDVVAIGNPLGREFRSTMTDGIISAIDRSVVMDGNAMALLQTNAAINEGNSGGPLINRYGQIVGITNMKMVSYYSGIEGIGFAIPSRQMKTVVDHLIETGYAAGTPMLGIVGNGPPENMAPEDIFAGVYVDSVDKRSDAYRSGLRPGDFIMEFNGETVEFIEDIVRLKANLGIGDTVSVTVVRNGETLHFTFRLMDSRELE